MTPKTKLPNCCGREMQVKADTGRFWEVCCSVCRDVVYIKKSGIPKPLLLDD